MNCPYCGEGFDGVHTRYAHITTVHAAEEKARMDKIHQQREALKDELGFVRPRDPEGEAWRAEVDHPIDKLVLLSILRHDTAQREASHKSLAKHTGIPERSLHNITTRLRKRNLIFATKGYVQKVPGERVGGAYHIFHISGVANSGE